MMLKNAVRPFSFWSIQLVHGQISHRGTQKAWRQQRFLLCAVKSTYRATAIIFVMRRTWGCFGCSVEAEGMLGAVSRHSLRGRVLGEWQSDFISRSQTVLLISRPQENRCTTRLDRFSALEKGGFATKKGFLILLLLKFSLLWQNRCSSLYHSFI